MESMKLVNRQTVKRYMYIGPLSQCIALYSRMRNKCSALNADLYHANLIVNNNCLCGYFNENAEHYFTVTWFNLFISNNIIIRDKVNMLLCNK
jgi:hypothetical protein